MLVFRFCSWVGRLWRELSLEWVCFFSFVLSGRFPAPRLPRSAWGVRPRWWVWPRFVLWLFLSGSGLVWLFALVLACLVLSPLLLPFFVLRGLCFRRFRCPCFSPSGCGLGSWLCLSPARLASASSSRFVSAVFPAVVSRRSGELLRVWAWVSPPLSPALLASVSSAETSAIEETAKIHPTSFFRGLTCSFFSLKGRSPFTSKKRFVRSRRLGVNPRLLSHIKGIARRRQDFKGLKSIVAPFNPSKSLPKVSRLCQQKTHIARSFVVTAGALSGRRTSQPPCAFP